MLAVTATLRGGGTRGELEEKLEYSVSLVRQLQHAGRSQAITDTFENRQEEHTDSDKKTISFYRNIVWRRYNVMDSFIPIRLTHTPARASGW